MPHDPTLRLASDYLQRADAVLSWHDPTSAKIRLIIRNALAQLEPAAAANRPEAAVIEIFSGTQCRGDHSDVHKEGR